jgi:hypothetical protein
MSKIFKLVCCCAIGLIMIFSCSLSFAQEKAVELSTKITRIPDAKIIDWEGLVPTVNGELGWQERALKANDKICCPCDQPAEAFVTVALDRYATETDTLLSKPCPEESCIVIPENPHEVYQDSGESFVGLSLGEGSEFNVKTPTAVVGASGTAFSVIVNPDGATEVEVLETTRDLEITELGTGTKHRLSAEKRLKIKPGEDVIEELLSGGDLDELGALDRKIRNIIKEFLKKHKDLPEGLLERLGIEIED